MMSTQTITEDKARDIASDHGRSAAGWAFDGNTTCETYAAIVRQIDDGDPALYDSYREPSLSGEFADEYSERDLADDLDLDPADLGDLANAFNDAASEAFWDEIERVAREHVAWCAGPSAHGR